MNTLPHFGVSGKLSLEEFSRRLDQVAHSHFAYLLPLGAISPTHAKYDQNNVKLLKKSCTSLGVAINSGPEDPKTRDLRTEVLRAVLHSSSYL